MLDPDPQRCRERLGAHLREQPTLSAAQELLAIERRRHRCCPAKRSACAKPWAMRQALHRYRCAACGFEAQHYFWQCPGCLSWDSYPPQRLEDLG